MTTDGNIHFQHDQKTLSSLVAYLIGVNRDNLYELFEDDMLRLKELDNNPNTRVLRCLCKIRTKLLSNFVKTENAIKYDLKNLNTLDDFKDDIQTLEKLEVYIVKSNCRVNKYIVNINLLIIKYIDFCRDLIPEWVEWQFIRKLFLMPSGTKEECIKDESLKYNGARSLYPYGQYINWQPRDEGNILRNDKKFLKILYEQNGKTFTDNSKVLDANRNVKANIYHFIDSNESTVLVVDCENSDPYKLYAVLKNLNQDETNKIRKIILYDDVHTTSAWKNLEKFVSIPLEYVLIERLYDNKSLLDMRMIAGISANYYRDNIKSFIIVSSDSDYWAIISSLTEANYLVMLENTKCGKVIKDALNSREIYHCSIDDFCSGNISDFKNFCLLSELDKRIENIIDLNAKTLLESIYTACRLEASNIEKNNFNNKYIKRLKLQINDNHDFYISRE